MKLTQLSLVCIVVIAGGASSAFGFTDDFESYGGTSGSSIGTVSGGLWTDTTGGGMKWVTDAPDYPSGVPGSNKAVTDASAATSQVGSERSFSLGGEGEYTFQASFLTTNALDAELGNLVELTTTPPPGSTIDERIISFGMNRVKPGRNGLIIGEVGSSGSEFRFLLDAMAANTWYDVKVVYALSLAGADTFKPYYKEAASDTWLTGNNQQGQPVTTLEKELNPYSTNYFWGRMLFSGTNDTYMDNAEYIVRYFYPGDANKDGTVDATDAAILADNWLMSSGASWGDGDFDGDGMVNDVDATMMATNWGKSTDGAASVPEPAALLYVFTICLALAAIVRKQRPGAIT